MQNAECRMQTREFLESALCILHSAFAHAHDTLPAFRPPGARGALRQLAGAVESTHVLVVTDPLLLPSKNLSRRLIAALQGSVEAALPVMNLPANPAQQQNVETYATLRELEVITSKLEAGRADLQRMTWDASDPFVFACR